jgi:hypothetical protein
VKTFIFLWFHQKEIELQKLEIKPSFFVPSPTTRKPVEFKDVVRDLKSKERRPYKDAGGNEAEKVVERQRFHSQSVFTGRLAGLGCFLSMALYITY